MHELSIDPRAIVPGNPSPSTTGHAPRAGSAAEARPGTGPGAKARAAVVRSARTHRPARQALVVDIDPLAPDGIDDEPVVTSGRALARLALVSSEVGAGLAREARGRDAMAWMTEKREIFGGAAAIAAALDRDGCLTALLLADVDVLPPPTTIAATRTGRRDVAVPRLPAQRSTGARLHTATLAWTEEGDGGCTLAFDALVCVEASVLRDRVMRRVGSRMSEHLVVREGFDWSEPVASVLVSAAVADVLAHAEAAPDSEIAAGLDLVVQHSFAS